MSKTLIEPTTNKVDLFEFTETLPKVVKNIIDRMCDQMDETGLDYEDCKQYLSEVERYGYTFDYGLDAEPYELTIKP